MDSLQSINAFVAVVEAGSFRRAAELLGLTSSAISKSIGRLEANLGLRLLQRTTRSLTLTEDGATYFKDCRRILSDLDDANERLSRKHGILSGRVHVHVPHDFAQSYMIPALGDFLSRYPEIDLRLSLADSPPAIIEERLDFGIHVGEITDKQLVGKILRGSRGVTAAAPAYLDRRGVPKSLAELEQHDCVLFIEPGSSLPWPWIFEDAGRIMNMRPHPRLLANSNTAVLDAALAGIGIIQSADYVLERSIETGRLVPLLAHHETKGPPIQLVWPRDRHLSGRMKVFIEWVQNLADDTSEPPR